MRSDVCDLLSVSTCVLECQMEHIEQLYTKAEHWTNHVSNTNCPSINLNWHFLFLVQCFVYMTRFSFISERKEDFTNMSLNTTKGR